MKSYNRIMLPALLLVIGSACAVFASETLERLIAAAKKEGEMTFIAGAQTYGGRQGIAEIEAAFAKKYGFTPRIHFAAGPGMPARAAQIITEMKTGRKSSTDVFLGAQSHFALLHKDQALEAFDWSGHFPWITKAMEATPAESVLSHTSLNGIVYNSQKDFARKLVALSGGRLRYNEEERIVSGEFPIMANMGGALEHMWHWQSKRAPLVGLPGSNPPLTSYFQLGVPKNVRSPNLAKLFVALMASKEGQAIQEKYEFQSSHLVQGTIMAKYVADHGLRIPEPKQGLLDYLKGEAEGLKLQTEIARILK
jgi:hypothetical protein